MREVTPLPICRFWLRDCLYFEILRHGATNSLTGRQRFRQFRARNQYALGARTVIGSKNVDGTGALQKTTMTVLHSARFVTVRGAVVSTMSVAGAQTVLQETIVHRHDSQHAPQDLALVLPCLAVAVVAVRLNQEMLLQNTEFNGNYSDM